MFIPKFVSLSLRAILANFDFGLKREGAITHDLHEHFANGPMVEKLIESARKATKPRKIIRKRWFADEEEQFRKEMAA